MARRRRRPVRDQRGVLRGRLRAPGARHPRGPYERERRRGRARTSHRRERHAPPRHAPLRAARASEEAGRRVALPRRRRGRRARRGAPVVRVGVVGAGTMGNGIAQTFAMNGHDVTMVDVGDAQLERGMKAIRGSLAKLEEKKKLTAPAEAIAGRIRTSTDVSALKDADLVVEAAFEDPMVKQDLFARLDGVTPQDAILASNTSSISIDALASRTSRPARVAGMHFMNPVPIMQLVEVVRGPRTSDETLRAIVDLAKQLGKTPVVSADRPGFIANRVLMPMINEAFLALG